MPRAGCSVTLIFAPGVAPGFGFLPGRYGRNVMAGSVSSGMSSSRSRSKLPRFWFTADAACSSSASVKSTPKIFSAQSSVGLSMRGAGCCRASAGAARLPATAAGIAVRNLRRATPRGRAVSSTLRSMNPPVGGKHTLRIACRIPALETPLRDASRFDPDSRPPGRSRRCLCAPAGEAAHRIVRVDLPAARQHADRCRRGDRQRTRRRRAPRSRSSRQLRAGHLRTASGGRRRGSHHRPDGAG